MNKTTYTITFGDVCENGVGMQKIGNKNDKGFSVAELKNAKRLLIENGYRAYYFNLNKYCPKELNPEEAGILYIANGVEMNDNTHDELFEEQETLTYDLKKFMRGRVVNSLARHNICFADDNQEPDYDEGMGRIVSFDEVLYLKKLRLSLEMYLGPKARNLYAEGNKYYDIAKTGIGFHGDTERSIVVGVRLGKPMDLSYVWYYRTKPVGTQLILTLPPGCIYVMSQKAVGNDWKKQLFPTLRHSAGCCKYTKLAKSK